MSLTNKLGTKSIITIPLDIDLCKMVLPDWMRKRILEIAIGNTQVITQHDNLRDLTGRTGWKFHLQKECNEEILPELFKHLHDGIKTMNKTTYNHHLALEDFWVAWYNKNSIATRHHHFTTWDSLSFVWYLSVQDEYTSIVFCNGLVEWEVSVKPNDLIIFPGRLEHFTRGNEDNRTIASGNLYMSNPEKFVIKAMA
tara:strand:+ start:18635 stop:19225 length:591 start_codon:yes stop_codon:yes gene_type:complete